MSRVATTARQLALDAGTAEVVDALAAHGIRSILLKGAAIADRLYDDPSERPYGDVDLLVDPTALEHAQGVLERIGFERVPADAPHATTWRRGAVFVDLHSGVYWAPVAWDALSRDTGELRVGGRAVEVLSAPAQAFVVAAHAVQHGPHEQPRADLERALQRFELAVWHDAAALAAKLGCEAVFVTGLRLSAAGAEIARALGLDADPPSEARLRIAGAEPVSVFLLRAKERPARERIAFVAGRLFPSGDYLRYWTSKEGRAGMPLVLVYPYRLLVSARRLPAALRVLPDPGRARTAAWTLGAVLEARRAARGAGVPDPLRPAPSGATDHMRTANLVLRALRTTCLESSLVRQALDAGAGRQRELVIGVTGARDGFRAHAWLDGDRVDDDFTELTRVEPRR